MCRLDSPIRSGDFFFERIRFDGKEGTTIKEFGLQAANTHTASILSFSWSPDGKSILTASMDRSARLWDVESGTVKQLRIEFMVSVNVVVWVWFVGVGVGGGGSGGVLFAIVLFALCCL